MKENEIFGKEEFSQNADDTALLLPAEKNILRECMKVMETFHQICGLKMNIGKIKVIKSFSWRDSMMQFCTDLNLIWINEFVSLWNSYNVLQIEQMTEHNLEMRRNDNNRLCEIYLQKQLTQFGKITVTNSNFISKLRHILLSLPTPTQFQIQNLKVFFNHLNGVKHIRTSNMNNGKLNWIWWLKYVKHHYF